MARTVSARVIAALVCMLMVGTASPAVADHLSAATPVTGSFAITGGKVEWRATRHAWGVTFKIKVTDTKADGKCAGTMAKIFVSGGDDKVRKKTPIVCGNGKSKTAWFFLAGPDSVATRGPAITHVRVYLCVRDEYDIRWHSESSYTGSSACGASDKKVLPQHASDWPSSAVRDRFWDIMNMPMADFLALRKVKLEENPALSTFTWNTDGKCSLANVPGVTSTWNSRFLPSCLRHDFAYGSLGSNKSYLPTDAARLEVDIRFQTDMYAQCRVNEGRWGSRYDCYRVADLYYAGVRDQGGPFFYPKRT